LRALPAYLCLPMRCHPERSAAQPRDLQSARAGKPSHVVSSRAESRDLQFARRQTLSRRVIPSGVEGSAVSSPARTASRERHQCSASPRMKLRASRSRVHHGQPLADARHRDNWASLEARSGAQRARLPRIERLVHVEVFGEITEAIAREKELKGWRREKKVALIRATIVLRCASKLQVPRLRCAALGMTPHSRASSIFGCAGKLQVPRLRCAALGMTPRYRASSIFGCAGKLQVPRLRCAPLGMTPLIKGAGQGRRNDRTRGFFTASV
jgi:hypothetical protein